MADLVFPTLLGLVIFGAVCAMLVALAEQATAKVAKAAKVAKPRRARPLERAGRDDRAVYRITTPVQEEILADELEIAGALGVEIGSEIVMCEVPDLQSRFDVAAVAMKWGLIEEGAEAPAPSTDWDRVREAHATATPLRVSLGAPMRVERGEETVDAWRVELGTLVGILRAEGAPRAWSSSPPTEVDVWVLAFDRDRQVLEFIAWSPVDGPVEPPTE